MRVLLADDQPQVRSALRLFLEQDDVWQVVAEAANSESLLAQTQTSQPDLVLLDWELPGMSTIELLAQLRHCLPHLFVIVLSSRFEARQAALEAGSDAFISKSSPPRQLLATLQMLRKELALYKKILVPLDGSPRAEKILPHVENLARAYHAKLILLGIVEVAPIIMVEAMKSNLKDIEYERHIQEVEDYLDRKQALFQRQDIDTEIRVGHGPVVQAIIHTAREEDVDLIALVSHGRTGLAQVFYGSVAAGILHQVNRPLLIIRSMI